MYKKLVQFFGSLSVLYLNWQSEHLQKKLIKKLGYDPKKNPGGGKVEISQAEKDKIAHVETEVRGLLDRFKGEVDEVVKFLETHKIHTYKVKHAQKLLKKIGERSGFITERHGLRALMLNLVTGNGIKFKTEPMIVVDDDESSIYNYIHYLHKWFAMKEGLPGFDEKSQRLLQKFKLSKNSDKIIKRLSIPQIAGLRRAIARDVQSIDFMSQYTREHEGSQKALEKMKKEGSIEL